jgi:hypothetical protein
MTNIKWYHSPEPTLAAFSRRIRRWEVRKPSCSSGTASARISIPRARLKEATARGDGEVEIAARQELVESLEYRSRTLLEEIKTLRSSGPQ